MLETTPTEMSENRRICRLKKPSDLPLRFTLDQFNIMPVVHVGQFDNVMLEGEINGNRYRICLSRMFIRDGAPCNNMVTVLCAPPPAAGRSDWLVVDEYEAK